MLIRSKNNDKNEFYRFKDYTTIRKRLKSFYFIFLIYFLLKMILILFIQLLGQAQSIDFTNVNECPTISYFNNFIDQPDVVNFIPDFNFLIVNQGIKLQIILLESGSIQDNLIGHHGNISKLVHSQQLGWLVSSGLDSQLIVWQLGNDDLLASRTISGLVTHMEILDDTESIIVGTTRSQIFVWAPKSDQDRLSYTSGNIEQILSFTTIKNGSDIVQIVSSGLSSNGTLFIETFEKEKQLLDNSYNTDIREAITEQLVQMINLKVGSTIWVCSFFAFNTLSIVQVFMHPQNQQPFQPKTYNIETQGTVVNLQIDYNISADVSVRLNIFYSDGTWGYFDLKQINIPPFSSQPKNNSQIFSVGTALEVRKTSNIFITRMKSSSSNTLQNPVIMTIKYDDANKTFQQLRNFYWTHSYITFAQLLQHNHILSTTSDGYLNIWSSKLELVSSTALNNTGRVIGSQSYKQNQTEILLLTYDNGAYELGTIQNQAKYYSIKKYRKHDLNQKIQKSCTVYFEYMKVYYVLQTIDDMGFLYQVDQTNYDLKLETKYQFKYMIEQIINMPNQSQFIMLDLNKTITVWHYNFVENISAYVPTKVYIKSSNPMIFIEANNQSVLIYNTVQVIYVLSAQTFQIMNLVTSTGVYFQQIKQGTNFSIIVVLKNTPTLVLLSLASLLKNVYYPYQKISLQTDFVGQIFVRNMSLLSFTDESILLISMTDYLNPAPNIRYQQKCYFSYSYKSTSSIIAQNVQNNVKTVALLLKSFPYLQRVLGKIIMSLNLVINWRSVVIDQKQNEKLDLLINCSKISKDELNYSQIILRNQEEISNLNILELQQITILVADPTSQNCQLTFNNIRQLGLQKIRVRNFFNKSKVCPKYRITQVDKFQMQDIQIQNQSFLNKNSSIFFDFQFVEDIILINLSFQYINYSNLTLISVFGAQSKLSMQNVVVENLNCDSSHPSLLLPLFSLPDMSLYNINIIKNDFCNGYIFARSIQGPLMRQSIVDVRGMKVINNIFSNNGGGVIFDFTDGQQIAEKNQINLASLILKDNYFNGINNTRKFYQYAFAINIQNFFYFSLTDTQILNNYGMQGISLKDFSQLTIKNYSFKNGRMHLSNYQRIALKAVNFNTCLIDGMQIKYLNITDGSTVLLQGTTLPMKLVQINNSIFSNNFVFARSQEEYLPLISIISTNVSAITLYNCSMINQQLISSLTTISTLIRINGFSISLTLHEVYVDNTIMFQNSQLMIFQVLKIMIDNSIFQNSFSRKEKFYNINNTFNSETRLLGGFIFLKAQIGQIRNSIFVNSSAYQGGAIYWQIQSFQGIDQMKIDDDDHLKNTIFQIVDRDSDSPILLLSNITFQSIFSTSYGGVLNVFVKTSYDSYFVLIFETLNVINCSSIGEGGFMHVTREILKNQQTGIDLKAYIQMAQVNFQNIFSLIDGSIFSGEDCLLQLKDVNISQSHFFLPNYYDQQDEQIQFGSFFELSYSLIVFKDVQVQNNIQNLGSDYKFINIEKSHLYINSLFITNLDWWGERMIRIHSSYLEVDQLTIENCNCQGVNAVSLFQLENSTGKISNFTMSNVRCWNEENGLFVVVDSNFTLENSLFFKNSQFHLGVLQLQTQAERSESYQSLMIILRNVSFIQNNGDTQSSKGGALFINVGLQVSVLIENSFFEENIAKVGGAIYLQIFWEKQYPQKPNIFINNSRFFRNSAEYGGALKELGQGPVLIECEFQNNHAQQEGDDVSAYGSIIFLLPTQPQDYQNYTNFLYEQKKLSNNQTVYVTPPSYNFTPVDSSRGTYSIMNYRSGEQIQTPLKFLVKSSGNITLNFLNGTEFSVFFENKSYSLTKSQYIDFNNNVFIIENLTMYGDPGSTTNLSITTNLIQTLNDTTYLYQQTYQYKLAVQFRECYYGEIISNIQNIKICQACQKDYYSFEQISGQNEGNCKQCQTASKNLKCYGGALTEVAPGYWRQQVLSTEIFQCDKVLSNCTGGNSTNLCGQGYSGPLCKECLLAHGYARNVYRKCSYCKDSQWPWPQIILKSLIEIFYLTLSIVLASQDVVNLCLISFVNRMLPVNKEITLNTSEMQESNSLMKTFMAYLQIVGLVKYVVEDLPFWSEDVSDPNILSYSMDCALLEMSIKIGVPQITLKYIVLIFQPFIILLLFYLYFAIIYRNNIHYKQIYYTSSWLIIWMFFLPVCFKETIFQLNCQRIGDQLYRSADLTEQCYGPDHFLYALLFAIPGLTFFVIAIPGYLLVQIKDDIRGESTDELHSNSLINKYKYYYVNGEFNNKFFYWEFVRLCEKLLIQMFLEILKENVLLMSEAILMVVSLYGIVSYYYKPYLIERQNSINLISILSSFNTINLAVVIMILQGATFKSYQVRRFFIFVFQLLLLICNLIYFIWIIRLIAYSYLPVIEIQILELKKLLAKNRVLRRLLEPSVRANFLWKIAIQKTIMIRFQRKKLDRKLEREQLKRQFIKSGTMIESMQEYRERRPTETPTIEQYIQKLDIAYDVDIPQSRSRSDGLLL